MQLSFYKTISSLTDKTFCLLTEKCYHGNFRVVAITRDIDSQERLNKLLWVYAQKQFIPHGSNLDPLPGKQPVYLTQSLENPNNANILILVNTIELLGELAEQYDKFVAFERIIVISDDAEFNVKDVISRLPDIDIEVYQQKSGGSWQKMEVL